MSSATLRTFSRNSSLTLLQCLHGPAGEDGSIQGVLEILRIPYTHSGVLASALAMNKQMAKLVMAAADVPVPEGKVVSRLEAAKAHVLPPPYVLKPIAEGSSYGVFIVREGQGPSPQELRTVKTGSMVKNCLPKNSFRAAS